MTLKSNSQPDPGRDYKVISADTHIVEPPDLYEARIEPRFRDRVPLSERRTTATGREYDAWILNGSEVCSAGRFAQAGRKYQDPDKIESLSTWEEVSKAAYDPHEMVRELEMDGVWGAIIQPSAGLLWYKITDTSGLISALCRAYNSWVVDFCNPYRHRLQPIGCINVDDIDEACRDLQHCAAIGCKGVFIPVHPLPGRPYRDSAYDILWQTAQECEMPLLMHVGAIRSDIPGSEFTMKLTDLTAAGRSIADQWIRYSLAAMIFAGVFDRYPGLQVGSVEHETGWLPFWLKRMDQTYRERPVHTGGWKSRDGMIPSDFWHRNMFVEFMEDDVGVLLRDLIGVDNMLWGNDFPHSESTWPKSMEFLDRVFADDPNQDRRKITSDNSIALFHFDDLTFS